MLGAREGYHRMVGKKGAQHFFLVCRLSDRQLTLRGSGRTRDICLELKVNCRRCTSPLDRNHIKQSRRDIELFLLPSLTTQLDDLCDKRSLSLRLSRHQLSRYKTLTNKFQN
jgi:hypothetical protein